MTRSNPKRSGGPKSESGKLAVTRNALTTGAYALTVILPGEDEAAFRELEDQFLRDFAPQDVAESAMVRDLAVMTWKKLRLEHLEQAAMLRELNEPFSAIAFSGDEKAKTAANLLLSLGDDIVAYRRAADKAQELLSKGMKQADIPRLEADYPVLYASFEAAAEDYFDEPPSADAWMEALITEDSGEDVPFHQFVLQDFLEGSSTISWALKHEEEIRARMQRIQQSRLLKFIEQKSKLRARDDLDRAFYRTLSELRRQQDWRRKRTEITVNPQPGSAEQGTPT